MIAVLLALALCCASFFIPAIPPARDGIHYLRGR